MALLSIESIQKSAQHFIDKSQKNSYDSIGFTDEKNFYCWANQVLTKYNRASQVFDILEKVKINSKRTVYQASMRNKILFYAIVKNLKTLFSITPSSRNHNVMVLKNIFTSNNRLTILKLDIKKFYDNISHDKLIEIMRKNRLLDSDDIKLVEHFLSSTHGKLHFGVHQGTELSNSLAEIFFNSIDKKLRSLDSSLIFSERYVDDIILVFNRVVHEKDVKEFYTRISRYINDYSLEFNVEKTRIISINIYQAYNCISCRYSEGKYNNANDYLIAYYLSKKGNLHKVKKEEIRFSYLGYRFNWVINIGKVRFHVDVSDKKIYKYKTRIYKMFLAFKLHRAKHSNQHDYAYYLLRERIRFFCSTFVLPSKNKHSPNTVIGIQSNYRHIQEQGQIDNLYTYIKKSVFFLFKNNMVDSTQMRDLMLVVIKQDSAISFTSMDANQIKNWIIEMSSIAPAFIKTRNDMELRRSLTSMYLKRVKIEQ